MNSEKLVPKLRFSGFDAEWFEVKLDNIAKFSKGKGISKKDISEEGLECVRYGELYTKYNEVIYEINSKTNLNKEDLILSEENDILIPCSGETAIDLATASCIPKSHVAIGGDITIIKTNQYAPFITYYLNQKKNEIAKFAQGVSIVHLYPKDFKIMKMCIPSINEQKKIINFIEEITKKEQLLTEKYQYYQDFKKYLMQQIFTQKSRFNFDDNLEIVKLSELTDKISSGKTNLKKSNEENGKYPIYGSRGIIGNMNNYDYDDDFILVARVGANAGSLFKISGKCGITDNTLIIKTNENIHDDFLFYYLQYYNLNRLIFGSGQPLITGKQLKMLKINIPSIKEQYKISKMLLDFDKSINLLEEYYESLLKFKKGLLQQMFV